MVAPRKRSAKAQAEQHLAVLQAAGVDYVPDALPPPVAPPPVAEPAPALQLTAPTEIAGHTTGGSLFDDAVRAGLPTTPEGRRTQLEVLAAEVSTCPRCPELYATRNKTVFGVGPLSPEILFLGEAPGEHEDRTGVPFVGASGQLLDRILSAMGVARSEIYIANILKCRPPQNRDPKTEECVNCRPYLEQQLELVQPKLICCLGATPANRLMGLKNQTLGKLRGKWHDYKGTPVLVSYHPAALLRNPEWKRDTWADMQLVLAKLGREVPRPGARG